MKELNKNGSIHLKTKYGNIVIVFVTSQIDTSFVPLKVFTKYFTKAFCENALKHNL